MAEKGTEYCPVRLGLENFLRVERSTGLVEVGTVDAVMSPGMVKGRKEGGDPMGLGMSEMEIEYGALLCSSIEEVVRVEGGVASRPLTRVERCAVWSSGLAEVVRVDADALMCPATAAVASVSSVTKGLAGTGGGCVWNKEVL